MSVTSSHPSSPKLFRISPGLCGRSGATKYSHCCTGDLLPVVRRSADQLLVDRLHADAHHDVEPGVRGDPPRLLTVDPLLQPQGLRPDLDRLARDRRRVLRTAEHVHHVDLPERLLRRGERRIGRFALHLGLVRVDRDHAVALREQVAEHPVRRPVLTTRGADHRDGLPGPEQLAQLAVVRCRPLAHSQPSSRIASRNVFSMRAVAPQMTCPSCSNTWPVQVLPSISHSTSRSTDRRVRTGISSTSAISAGFGLSAGSSGSIPTNGTTTKPLTKVGTGGSAPSTSTEPGSMPSSSCVSRRAVARRSGSSSWGRPPGNETSPPWWLSVSARTVNTSDGFSPSITGTRTPAGTPPSGTDGRASRCGATEARRSRATREV